MYDSGGIKYFGKERKRRWNRQLDVLRSPPKDTGRVASTTTNLTRSVGRLAPCQHCQLSGSSRAPAAAVGRLWDGSFGCMGHSEPIFFLYTFALTAVALFALYNVPV